MTKKVTEQEYVRSQEKGTLKKPVNGASCVEQDGE